MNTLTCCSVTAIPPLLGSLERRSRLRATGQNSCRQPAKVTVAEYLAAIEDAATISRGFTAIGGLVVDAKDQRAAAFYERFAFSRIEEGGLQLFMPIQDCVSLMNEPDESYPTFEKGIDGS